MPGHSTAAVRALLRAACGIRQEERGPEIRSKTILAGLNHAENRRAAHGVAVRPAAAGGGRGVGRAVLARHAGADRRLCGRQSARLRQGRAAGPVHRHGRFASHELLSSFEI